MTKRRRRTYELYCSSPGSIVKYYGRSKPWVIKVRAVSIKQAYWLVGNQVMFDGYKGIISLDNCDGPNRSFPFADRMRAALPRSWRNYDYRGTEEIIVDDRWY